MVNWVKKHWEALAVGGVLGVVGLVLWEKRAAATTTVVVPVPGAAPVPAMPTSRSSITLIPGLPAYSYSAKIGDSVTIQLPAGARWINNGSGPATDSTPVSWTYQGPGTVNLLWVDATMQPQSTALTFYTSG
jgi:hypothetical protein